MEEDSKGTGLGNVIRIDDDRTRDHLGKIVRGSVEETLNALLEAEADRLCNARRYERREARRDLRSGGYDRKLQTRAGEIHLKVPKLRRQAFETAIIERYRRRESSVEEALIEMYLAGVSVRRVEDITEALWGTRVSPATVSNLNQRIYRQKAEHRMGRNYLKGPEGDRINAVLAAAGYNFGLLLRWLAELLRAFILKLVRTNPAAQTLW
jgi:putative transposase